MAGEEFPEHLGCRKELKNNHVGLVSRPSSLWTEPFFPSYWQLKAMKITFVLADTMATEAKDIKLGLTDIS